MRLHVAVHGLEQFLGNRGIRGGQFPGLAAERIARGVLFPAAAVAALAAVPARHDDLVAELPRHTEAAAFEPSVHDHGPADSGSQGDADQTVLSLPGAEAPFRPGGGVGVVGQQDGAAQQPLQVLAQRFIAPGQVRAEEDSAAVEVHPAGGADSDRPDPVSGAQLSDQFDNDLFHGARVVARGGAFGLAEDPALGVHHAGSNLGSPDVDADRQALAAQPQV